MLAEIDELLTFDQIKEIIQGHELFPCGESQFLEFKKTTNETQRAAKTIVEFLNAHKSGNILIGVQDDGKVIGHELGSSTISSINEDLKQHIFPDIRYEVDYIIKSIPLQKSLNKHVTVISIFSRNDNKRVYFYKGRPRKRIGKASFEMGQSEVDMIMKKFYQSDENWENDVEKNKLEEIDRLFVKEVISNAVKNNILKKEDGWDELSIEEILVKFHLLSDDKINNAAIALFGNEAAIEKRFPQLKVKIGVFSGTNKETLTKDQTISGNIVYLINTSANIVKQHIPTIPTIPEGTLQLTTVPIIDDKYHLREVISNAFSHRNYLEKNRPVEIAIYANCIEITNPGALTEKLSIEDLYRTHSSLSRNKRISDVLHRLKYQDLWGRGTVKVYLECKERGIEVQYHSNAESDEFSVKFMFPPEVIPYHHIAKVSNAQHELEIKTKKAFDVLRDKFHKHKRHAFESAFSLLSEDEKNSLKETFINQQKPNYEIWLKTSRNKEILASKNIFEITQIRALFIEFVISNGWLGLQEEDILFDKYVEKHGTEEEKAAFHKSKELGIND